jgi:hypothetical protein
MHFFPLAFSISKLRRHLRCSSFGAPGNKLWASRVAAQKTKIIHQTVGNAASQRRQQPSFLPGTGHRSDLLKGVEASSEDVNTSLKTLCSQIAQKCIHTHYY